MQNRIINSVMVISAASGAGHIRAADAGECKKLCAAQISSRDCFDSIGLDEKLLWFMIDF